MARIRSLLGDIEGSAGQITFSKQNGKNILRQKVGSNSSNSPAQQNTRSRFKLLADLFRRFGGAVQLGLKSQGGHSPALAAGRGGFAPWSDWATGSYLGEA